MYDGHVCVWRSCRSTWHILTYMASSAVLCEKAPGDTRVIWFDVRSRCCRFISTVRACDGTSVSMLNDSVLEPK